MSEKSIEQLKAEAFEALREAEQKWYKYFCACDLGHDRIKASEIYENVRTAARVGQ